MLGIIRNGDNMGKYDDKVRKKTLNVLIELCKGDLIMAYGALRAIYPKMWKDEITPRELREYGDLIEEEASKY